jgi:hypothetical protein
VITKKGENMKKNRKKYIFINMILFIIVSLIIMFFSKLDLQERFLGIGIMFFGNIICLLLFMLVNYFWYRTLKHERYVLINKFWIIGSIITFVSIILINIHSIIKDNEIELLLFITPLITILLLNIYIKNNILNKDN